MTPLRLAFAFLLATMALCSTPSRAQTQVQFILETGSDDLRDDSIADYQVELDDGRIVNGYVYGRLADGTTHTAPPLDLPTGLTRANIRFVRVMFSCCAPGPYPRPLDADKFWQGDQWEVHITVKGGVRPSGGGMTAFTDILADSGRWFKFQHPGWWESGPMAAQRLPASITGAMNNRFVLTICTGDDDLRTDPRAQPNSEVEVFANLTNPSGGPPVPVKLDTGRLVHRDFVSPGWLPPDAPTRDSAWIGSFTNWGCAWASADAHGMIPRLTDIQSFSITMVPGRPIHGITSCAPFCGSDPFRGDDEWVINGFSIAVDPLGTWGGGTTGSDSLHYIFSRLNIGQKRNKHDLTWISDPWMH